jgi:hypothetical protein
LPTRHRIVAQRAVDLSVNEEDLVSPRPCSSSTSSAYFTMSTMWLAKLRCFSCDRACTLPACEGMVSSTSFNDSQILSLSQKSEFTAPRSLTWRLAAW